MHRHCNGNKESDKNENILKRRLATAEKIPP
jgi:hypothetical protein